MIEFSREFFHKNENLSVDFKHSGNLICSLPEIRSNGYGKKFALCCVHIQKVKKYPAGYPVPQKN